MVLPGWNVLEIQVIGSAQWLFHAMSQASKNLCEVGRGVLFLTALTP